MLCKGVGCWRVLCRRTSKLGHDQGHRERPGCLLSGQRQHVHEAKVDDRLGLEEYHGKKYVHRGRHGHGPAGTRVRNHRGSHVPVALHSTLVPQPARTATRIIRCSLSGEKPVPQTASLLPFPRKLGVRVPVAKLG